MTRCFLLLMLLAPAEAMSETRDWEQMMREAAELRQARRFSDAHRRYADATAATALGPNLCLSVTRIAIGGLLRDEGRTAEAERIWRAELTRRQSSPEATLATVLLHLGDLYTSQQRYYEAEAMLLRSVAVTGGVPDGTASLVSALSSLGNLYLLQSKFEPAVNPLERALSPAPGERDQTLDTAVVSFTLAKVYSRLGRTDDADALFERSIALAGDIAERSILS